MKRNKMVCALTAAVLLAGAGLVSCGKTEDAGETPAAAQTTTGEMGKADITEAVTGADRPKSTGKSADGKDGGGKDADGKDADEKKRSDEEKDKPAETTVQPAATTAAATTVSTETQPTETSAVTETSTETSAVTTTKANGGGQGGGGELGEAESAWSEALSEQYQVAAKTQAEFLKTSAEGVLTLHDITGDPVPDGTYKKGDGSVIANELDKYAENDEYTIVIKDGKTVSVSIVTDGDDGSRIEETIGE